MDFISIVEYAKNGSTMPKISSQSEQLAYTTITGILGNWKLGLVTNRRALEEKERAERLFEDAKRIRDNFVRRLKRAAPEARIMVYMGRGKATHRIHLHMLSEGVPEELIRRQWYLGSVVRIEHLKEHNYYDGVDHGQDYTGLANYLFDHWTAEQGGHRWKPTKNLKQPERENPKEIKRQYTEQKPPRAPKGYVLVESKATGYGYLYFKYVKIPAKRTRKKLNTKK